MFFLFCIAFSHGLEFLYCLLIGCLFTWCKVLTLDLVERRDWSLVNGFFCAMKEEEMIDHL